MLREARRDRQTGALRREGGDGEARGTSLTKDWQRLSGQPQTDVETRDGGLQGRATFALRCVAASSPRPSHSLARDGSMRSDVRRFAFWIPTSSRIGSVQGCPYDERTDRRAAKAAKETKDTVS